MEEAKFAMVLAAESEKLEPLRSALGRKSSGFSRQDVVDALQNAFRMTGGVQRMALWANENYTEFMRIYSKLLPSTAIALGQGSELIIQHALPPSELDKHPGFDAPNVVRMHPKEGTNG